eukprot:XP_001694727.1 predicted protein [Chlamydomonas reinhardtii]
MSARRIKVVSMLYAFCRRKALNKPGLEGLDITDLGPDGRGLNRSLISPRTPQALAPSGCSGRMPHDSKHTERQQGSCGAALSLRPPTPFNSLTLL